MAKVGRRTVLNEKLTLKIQALVLAKVEYKTIQKQLRIAASTWDHWVTINYEGFSDKLWKWRLQRMLVKSVEVLENTLNKAEDKEDKKIGQDTAKFVTSTIGKKDFSTKTELGLPEGSEITIKLGKPQNE